MDSGIHAGHPHLGRIAEGVAIDERGVAGGPPIDRLGHGTAVAAAIQDVAPAVEIVPVRVFDRTLASTVDRLVAGVRWALDQDVALVNLSLGVTDPVHASVLRALVDDVNDRGVVLVAAGRDDGTAWLPGTLDGVVRVELDWTCPRGVHRFRRGPDGRPVFLTCGYPRPIPGVPVERNVKGLSFAVANVCGRAARLMADTGARGFDAVVTGLTESRERTDDG